jgi:class 3 adenylate cyclase/tetratricopeptide (TPR) repeat protein
MECPQCQGQNRPAARFCAECGAKLPLRCPHCAAEVAPTARFCDECGASLSGAPTPQPVSPPSLEQEFATLQQAMPASFREQLLTPAEGETRVVTVLFADMSGSVQAMGALHPEDAAALVSRLLKTMVDVLLKYEGRVDRFLGDGLLAVFGVPQAHESDPERALLAAMEIRSAAHEMGLQVTAGINTGEVYVGGVGSEQHREVTVMGPVVNLAARLQSHAAPDQILVGEAAYRHTRRAFEFSRLSLELRGFPEPVEAYLLERALPRPEKARGIEGLRAELIGRDGELSRLQDALQELLRGRGQIATLIGEAGVGKSRLVAELRAGLTPPPCPPPRSGEGGTLPDPGFSPSPLRGGGRGEGSAAPLWLEGRCLELSMTASYWLFVDLFRDYFAWQPEEDDRARGERLEACLRQFVARGELSAERCEEMGPLLGHLLSVRFGTDWDERLEHASPEQIRYQTFLAVRDFFVTLAKAQPIVLVLEDLHWADALSLDLISLLMETLTRDALFLLCVYRPERDHRCWRLGDLAAKKCLDRHTEIRLRELTPPQCRRLVESLLSIESLPASVKELILEKSRGNPFFVEEVVRSLIAAGMVYLEGDTWRAREGIETVSVPDSIQSVILSRVDRLERETKRVLESASVIGRLFRRRLLGRMLQQEQELEGALAELEERQLVYQERALPEEEYSFHHVLTQETVYGSILRRRRAAFHQQVAEAMEALYSGGLEEHYEQLAYHYERSAADEKAVEYLLSAGEKSRRAYLNDAAISYFQRALDRLEAGKQTADPEAQRAAQSTRLAALRGLGKACFGADRLAEAEEWLRQAIKVGRAIELEPEELARLYFWLTDVLFWSKKNEDLLTVALEALDIPSVDTESLQSALIYHAIALGHDLRGEHNQAQKLRLRIARFLPRLPYSEELRPVYICALIAYADTENDVETAERYAKMLEEHALQHYDLRGLGDCYCHVAELLWTKGDLRAALSKHQEALDLFRKVGDNKFAGAALRDIAFCLLTLGELGRAEEAGRDGLELLEHASHQPGLFSAYALLARIAVCRGKWNDARQYLEKVNWSPSWGQAWKAARHGRILQLQGERLPAVEHYRKALTLLATDDWDVWRTGELGQILTWLEESLDSPDKFRDLCTGLREEHAGLRASGLSQWWLEARQPLALGNERPGDECGLPPAPGWTWCDLFEDCSFTDGERLGIHAANGRDLMELNLSAPRFLRPATGEFAIQTICSPASPPQPAIGGLLIWKDARNFLRLERGTNGEHEITFRGRIDNQDLRTGRGCLPAARVFLRLERLRDRVNALCSADGEEWFTVGHVAFAVEDPVEVGLHALGAIDAFVYPGAYPEGTAIRFESFGLIPRSPDAA